ncbi:hypothetical protein PAHAL_2G089700 [Panicum hallii]|uniref:Uncharacterized protein n=1 Tax=Panicum hallii TaxID=206008 RepID=A0A2T8KNE5_9POAL|nr:hypothetical protein PAHAL_2G089700 [Panicum hallii]
MCVRNSPPRAPWRCPMARPRACGHQLPAQGAFSYGLELRTKLEPPDEDGAIIISGAGEGFPQPISSSQLGSQSFSDFFATDLFFEDELCAYWMDSREAAPVPGTSISCRQTTFLCDDASPLRRGLPSPLDFSKATI